MLPEHFVQKLLESKKKNQSILSKRSIVYTLSIFTWRLRSKKTSLPVFQSSAYLPPVALWINHFWLRLKPRLRLRLRHIGFPFLINFATFFSHFRRKALQLDAAHCKVFKSFQYITYSTIFFQRDLNPREIRTKITWKTLSAFLWNWLRCFF